MSLHASIDQMLTIIGVIFIVVPVTLMSEGWAPLLSALAGVVLIGVGVWRLGTRLLPDRRTYLALRSEVDGFIGLVRHLNERAVQGDTGEVEKLGEAMKASVDRMLVLAGRPGDE